ncbi:stage III sporulation protein AD [Pelagirhabdus alkalitolerans]|uniref:Stage III sporulation protein AD n=1 Tax=Pelagirhabdus alkalitolerans TaxID=1612202 RepID=A0A1G6I0K6_9BACI|nr:stage III sporulation protein AD [Pelagirhabdus alkalitolerans]SDB99991.1 stage III sporulation protein AD [Pelagirhabdus alkalitolerans]
MIVVQIVMMAIVGSILILLIKPYQPTIAFVLILLTSSLLFYYMLIPIQEMIQLLRSLTARFDFDFIYLDTIFQMVGIAYVSELGAHLTRDIGLESIAYKIELVGKLFILFISIPILMTVIETILYFIPNF